MRWATTLLVAARNAQCACSLLERDSGHLVDCWAPDLHDAIAKAEAESMSASTLAETPEVIEARRALQCLYIAVAQPVATDVQKKVEAAFASIAGQSGWRCKVRAVGLTDPPQDCDWPTCGCDPKANEIIAALEESGAFVEAEIKAEHADDRLAKAKVDLAHERIVNARALGILRDFGLYAGNSHIVDAVLVVAYALNRVLGRDPEARDILAALAPAAPEQEGGTR